MDLKSNTTRGHCRLSKRTRIPRNLYTRHPSFSLFWGGERKADRCELVDLFVVNTVVVVFFLFIPPFCQDARVCVQHTESNLFSLCVYSFDPFSSFFQDATYALFVTWLLAFFFSTTDYLAAAIAKAFFIFFVSFGALLFISLICACTVVAVTLSFSVATHGRLRCAIENWLGSCINDCGLRKREPHLQQLSLSRFSIYTHTHIYLFL